jgi:serine/threonine protein kinase
MSRLKKAASNGRQATAFVEVDGNPGETVSIRTEVDTRKSNQLALNSESQASRPSKQIHEPIEKLSDVTHKSEELPRKFKSYELVWKICRDALSTTYAVKKENIDRLLAIRIFNAKVSDSIQIRNIQKAASKAAELTHPNHVTVYESGVAETGTPYIVEDWVEGDTLAEVFEVTKRLDIARFLNIFNQVCEVLMEAHSRQLVHGNLSPNKIILATNDTETDVVKVIDFGMPPDPVQNAFYLSPEQCLDSYKVDVASDIYSLGCIMYESLVGTPPFVGNQLSQTGLNYLHELANQYSPDAPEHNALKLLDCIIVKCLQKKPSKRFRNIHELVDALRLVNDCICGGSTKKLPRKAEKLLLFRFLEFFDKKIVACLFAYLLLGQLSIKYIGELQLQKFIDQAQMAKTWNFPLAQGYWRKAIQEAELLGKPPSLKADLHWELGDALAQSAVVYYEPKVFRAPPVNRRGPSGGDQFSDSAGVDLLPHTNNDLATDAIKQYEQALQYFGKGYNYKSYALILLDKISQLWINMDQKDGQMQSRDKVVRSAQNLLHQKQFSKCAALCESYLRTQHDPQVAYYAALAYNEYATSLPENKGLRLFERAAHYSDIGQPYTSVADTNLNICISDLRKDPNSANVHLALGCEALEAGDIAAAEGEFGCVNNELGITLLNACQNYDNLRTDFSYALGEQNNSQFRRNAIQSLLQALAIEEEVYGKHSQQLKPLLTDLARSYAAAGEKQEAIDAYKRLFSYSTSAEGAYDLGDLSRYVDLLAETGQVDQAKKELEKRLIIHGKYDTFNPLFVRLIKAYADCKLHSQAHYAISQVVSFQTPYTPSANDQ